MDCSIDGIAVVLVMDCLFGFGLSVRLFGFDQWDRCRWVYGLFDRWDRCRCVYVDNGGCASS